jgi:hypothetical protein
MGRAKGVYVFLGARLNSEGQFARIETYVGGSFADAYRRISDYYQESYLLAEDRNFTDFILEVGIENLIIIFFKIIQLDQSKRVTAKAASELELYFIDKLKPSLNSTRNSNLHEKYGTLPSQRRPCRKQPRTYLFIMNLEVNCFIALNPFLLWSFVQERVRLLYINI